MLLILLNSYCILLSVKQEQNFRYKNKLLIYIIYICKYRANNGV